MSFAEDAGESVGKQLKEANSYKDNFIETEGTIDYNVAHFKNVKIFIGTKVTKKFITGCSPLPFVLEHPVQGALDSSIYALDGDYCSTSTFYDDTSGL